MGTEPSPRICCRISSSATVASCNRFELFATLSELQRLSQPSLSCKCHAAPARLDCLQVAVGRVLAVLAPYLS
jgi:hypothetical protein